MIVVYLCLSFFSNFGVPKWLPQAICLTDVTEIVDACYIVQHYATKRRQDGRNSAKNTLDNLQQSRSSPDL